jgi:TRAP-type uncharacterized transport system substrate-binding protein
MLGLRVPRFMLMVIQTALLLMVALIAIVYFLKPHATLRVTKGTVGGATHRLISALVKVSLAEYPRVHFQFVDVGDLAASSKALEDGKVDLAVVRSDVAPPLNGQTIAILRRDVFALIVPPNSSIEKIADLDGKTVGIPQSRLQDYNSQALDTVLSYYNIPAKSVNRMFLPETEIGQAVRQKHVVAVLAIGPMAPGEAVDVVSAIAKATKGAPELLAIDEAEAINSRFPGFESIDVPAGSFKGKPQTPDDSVTTLAVTYRLVAPNTMLNIVAGAIGRTIFRLKARLVAETPLANQIEVPDPDDKNPILPVHPGVAAYISSGEQSFFDEFQEYFYLGGMILGVIGSALALAIGRVSRRRSDHDQKRVIRLIEIADQAAEAQPLALDALEREYRQILEWILTREGTRETGSNVFSIALAHARHALDRRRDLLGAKPAPLPETPLPQTAP